MAIEGIRGIVQAAIQRASQATGVDFGFLMKTANRESGFNPAARAPTSSAAGLFQFVEQTWLATLKQHGAKHGYARYAELIERGADGRCRVVGPEARRAVMDLRLDPHAASLMAGELASDHAAYLRGRVGRPPTTGELYAAHFLGPEGSARLIQVAGTAPGAPAASYFPEAARANPSIFHRDGRAATVGEVYADLTRTGGDGLAAGQAGEGGFIRHAGDGGLDQRRQEEMLVAMLLRGPEDPGGEGAGQRLAGSLFTSEMLRLLSDARGKG